MLLRVYARYEWIEPRRNRQGQLDVPWQQNELQRLRGGAGYATESALRPAPGAAVVREYDPLMVPDLYWRFSDLLSWATDKQGMLAFASQFGLLGVVDYPAAEPMFIWQEERAKMWEVLEIWKGIRSGNPRGLARVDPLPDDTAFRQARPEAHRRRRLDHQARSIEEIVSARLTEHVGAWLSPRAYRRSIRFRMEYAPRTLLGALWLQCAGAITGQREFRQCKNCGARFDSKDRRADAKFCLRDDCRPKYHQRGMFAAGRLKRDGKLVAQIAEELDESPAQVRKWLQRLRRLRGKARN